MADREKNAISGESVTLSPGPKLDLKELARQFARGGNQAAERKLPPVPGRGPVQTFVPDDEILPRGKGKP